MLVPHHFVKMVTILGWIMGIEPVSVLEDDGLSRNIIKVRVEFTSRLKELFSVHHHTLLQMKELGEVVDDEVVPFLSIRPYTQRER
jgi:hypothetical protein